MTQAGGESATSGFREQMAWQLRAARVLTDLLERGAREGLPVLEWTISHTGARVTGRCYAQPGAARRACSPSGVRFGVFSKPSTGNARRREWHSRKYDYEHVG